MNLLAVKWTACVRNQTVFQCHFTHNIFISHDLKEWHYFGDNQLTKSADMLKSHLLIAWRNLAKQKLLSFIAVFGLSLGIACFSIFLLYALNEFSFDGFHTHSGQIYRAYVGDTTWYPHLKKGNTFTAMPLGPAMRQDLPDVVDYCRYLQPFETFIKVNNEGRRENIAFADSSFFSMFSFKLKYGDAKTALGDLHSLVLTENTARRLFGTADAVGKTLQVKVFDNNFEPLTVSAVVEDLPSNSSFSFSMLASMDYFVSTAVGINSQNKWGANFFQTFVQLRPGSRLPFDQEKLVAFWAHCFPDESLNRKANERPLLFGLEPLAQLHTDFGFGYFSSSFSIPPVDPRNIWILLSIAFGVLLISCINFTTLAVGRSANRAREVGVRKVIGGSKGNLRMQFLTEAALLTLISAIFGLCLADILLPFFNGFAGRSLTFSFLRNPAFAWVFAGLIPAVSLLAGIYPAWILSRFKPVAVLKTRVKLGGANFFTKALITLQFVLSAGLITGTILMMQQLHYMQSKDPGFDKENVVVLEALGIPNLKTLYPLFKQKLAAYPEILGIAGADCAIGVHEGLNSTEFNYNNKSIDTYLYFVDPDYVPLLGLKVLAGRNFNASIASDTLRSVLINETMMKAMGLTLSTAVGHSINGLQSGDSILPPVVIGVVKDMNFLSLDQPVQPQVFDRFPFHQPFRFFVRIRPGDPAKALAAIEQVWKKVAPDYPLKYNFMDENLDRFYTAEVRLNHIVGWAGGISIFLACLGLLGLAALTAANRTKEIGIRKVLGAPLTSIVALISRDFIRLVSIAFLLSIPLVWYVMNQWLQGYYYRIQISWWVFGLTGVAIIGIAWITVSYRAFIAGIENPVNSLRAE